MKSSGAAYHHGTRYRFRGAFPPPPSAAGLEPVDLPAPDTTPPPQRTPRAQRKTVDSGRLQGVPKLPRFSASSASSAVNAVDLWETLRARRSVRAYADSPLPVQALSRLVWASGGETGRREHGLAYRTTPSAGALYPVETYVSCRNVEGVAPGVYRYLPAGHILEPVRSGDISKDLADAALGQPFVARAAAVFVWTAVVERCTVKYADRGYRYIYMEAGIVSENLHLAATALGLGSCAVGAFSDGAVDALLGLDGTDEIALLLQAVGAPRS